MKMRMSAVVTAMVAVLAAASFSFAVEVKQPAAAVPAADTVKATAKTKAEAKIDINTADEATLKAIPGVGDTYASKIVAGRPYSKKTDLKTRKIVPADVYSRISPLIIAKRIKK
ncbi:MAG: helix-hairpin-helix domain-containing protein [Geobacter sp.]|jgi:DNA uptake protein ComE-like DNA-binding protein|nr:helix-hairpin-helix domain-containing protein [Geobacter sp.]